MRATTAAKHALARALAPVARTSAGSRILAYHSIVADGRDDPALMTTPLHLFEQQLKELVSGGYAVVPLRHAIAQLKANVTGPRTVVLTFDDGFEDLLVLALPMLRRYGFPATAFLTSGVVAREPRAIANSWPGRYLDVEQARELARSGLIEIGCHGATHVRLRGLDPATLQRETADARQALESMLDVEIRAFAYPFGSFESFDRRARAAVRDAGVSCAVTGIAGTDRPGSDVLRLRRSGISWAETPQIFRRVLAGAYDWYAGVQFVQAAIGQRLRVPSDAQ